MEAVEIVSKEYGRRRNTWSPEQIACTPTRFSMPSLLTIYRCIYDRYLLNGDLEVLRCKEKFIRMRGRPVQRWEEADHWDADTVERGQERREVCFATMVERKTCYYIAAKIQDRKAEISPESVLLH